MTFLKKKIMFIGGKGGVGKTTTSAALAYQSAQAGKKTLLISTDPAHNIGHIFKQKIGGKRRKVTDNLYAIEIDSELETKKYINQVKENIRGVVGGVMMDEVHRQLDTVRASPGTDEAALFDKLISIILDESEHFDQLIFDTAPTGHTIRLLSLPEMMGIWMKGMLSKRHKTKERYSRLLNDGEPVEDPIFDVLKARQEKFSKAREVMLDGKMTGFVFVLNPEYLPIIETENAIDMLDQYHLHVKTLIINRILPDGLTDDFFKGRQASEKKYLAKIDETFTKQEKIYIPYFENEILDLDSLARFAEHIYL